MKLSFLTREEKLVLVTLSLCLIGGGLFQMIASLFELPEGLSPPAQEGSQGLASGLQQAASGPRNVPQGAEKPPEVVLTAPATEKAPFAFQQQPGSSARQRASSGVTPHDVSGKLDLNTATPTELEALPGIGPALAGRIVEHREMVGGFDAIEDLLAVRGIGEKTLAKFREWVYVSHSGEPL